jgi:hypothetical protein
LQAQAEDESVKLDTIDFGRRMAVEKEMDAMRDKDPDAAAPNCVFDQVSTRPSTLNPDAAAPNCVVEQVSNRL